LFEEAFLDRGLPYSILSGRRFYERKHNRDAIAYMRLLLNPRDFTSLERVINEPPRGLGPVAFQKIAANSRETGVTLIEALTGASSMKGLTAPQKKSAVELGSVLADEASKAASQPLHHTLNEVLERAGYLRYLDAQGTTESQDRLEDLDQLMVSARVFSEGEGERGLAEYLEQVALVSDQDSYDDAREACVMGTLHSAKGLEFDVVFLVGMEEGLLPHARSIDDERQLEEERRLMYVGMTRAKKHLYLTFSFLREMNVGLSRVAVSRFVKEIPRELLDVKTWEG
jgi:DNA helicase-2/ATP-dependent DNA helicase PcrA